MHTPWPHDTPGARAFARTYLDTYADVAQELNTYVASHQVFGPMVAAIPPEVREQQERESRERLTKAFAGDWAGYARPLHEQGAQYATAGLRFSDWYDLMSAWSRALVPRLVRAHASDPELLSATLTAMHGFVERTMTVLGHSYIDTSEALLRKRQAELERWEAIFRHAGWGIVVVDAEGRIELANPAFASLLGAEHGALRSTRLASHFAEGEADRIAASFRESAHREGRAGYEVLLRRADGTFLPALVEATRLPEGPTETARWALSVVDLTERKNAEALARRSRELEEENRRVQEASRLKSEFLANMSHELRTPLNSIIGFAELLHLEHVGPMPAKQREFVGDILTSGRHLLRLINDVLDLSKVESGTMQFRPEVVDLRAIVDEVVGVLRGVAIERSIQIVTEVDEAARRATLDSGRLKQVLYNFLSNALKFGPSESRVDLRIRSEGATSVRIEVQDRGPGIALSDQPRLFREFEQLDAGRAKAHAGTGLGLALTRRLVEAQGGTVGVESVPGQGATFHAVLPRRARTTSLPQPRSVAGATASAPRILVVEDDVRDQERIVAMLVAAGYAVDTAATGAQARRACAERAYSAVTLDLLLPDCSGLEVLAAIRATDGNRAVPVIVISVVSEGVTSGFVVHDVLPKPIDAPSLLASLLRAGVTPPGGGPVLVVEDDEVSAKLVVETLSRLGFDTVVARDGEEALVLAAQTRPAAVVLDLIMPGLDGFGFLARFRAEPAWATIPVLVWTMKELGPDEHAALLENAHAVLVKDETGAIGLAQTLRTHLSPEADR